MLVQHLPLPQNVTDSQSFLHRQEYICLAKPYSPPGVLVEIFPP